MRRYVGVRLLHECQHDSADDVGFADHDAAGGIDADISGSYSSACTFGGVVPHSS